MDIKTKTELLKMSTEKLEIEENMALGYYKKVKAIIKFTELEE